VERIVEKPVAEEVGYVGLPTDKWSSDTRVDLGVSHWLCEALKNLRGASLSR
jgi:hypothetical protein